MIRLSLDTTNVQREKIVFELVKPFIPGFSVEPMEMEMEVDTPSTLEQQPLCKRKSIESSASGEITKAANDSAPSKTKKKNKKSKK